MTSLHSTMTESDFIQRSHARLQNDVEHRALCDRVFEITRPEYRGDIHIDLRLHILRAISLGIILHEHVSSLDKVDGDSAEEGQSECLGDEIRVVSLCGTHLSDDEFACLACGVIKKRKGEHF